MIRRRSPFRLSLLLLTAVLVPLAAEAQNAELTVTFPANGCVWNGPVSLTQGEALLGCSLAVMGSTTLRRVVGDPAGCPEVITGVASATLMGSAIELGIVDTDIGTFTFTGTVNPDGRSASGTWSGPPGTGAWFLDGGFDFESMSAKLTVVQPADGCQWRGKIEAAGGLLFTGSLTLARVAGSSPACPPTLSGPLSGNYLGPAICFDLSSGELGTLEFIGAVDVAGRSASGTWSGDPVSGTWSGQIGGNTQAAAPTLNGIGLLMLAGLLAAYGVAALRGRVF
ncbi:MAG TPA: hypothetical protein VL049_19670 [Candidatus Dormibacteraeota bacterium]|nr:hypothetical protein [Candidatus Dormibacteraeota bacterium]